MPPTTAFIYAMPMELRPLVKRLGLVKCDSTWKGSVGGRPVVATATGMGTELAAVGPNGFSRRRLWSG